MTSQRLKNWEPLTDKELEDWWPLVKIIARDFVISKNNNFSYISAFVTVEDIENELYVVLLEVIRTYDPNHPKKAKLKTCINQRCKQRLVDFQRSKFWIKRGTYRKLKEKDITYIKTNTETLGGLVYDKPIYTSTEQEEFAKYLFKDLANLKDPDRVYNMLYLFFVKNETAKDICHYYDVTTNCLYQIICKVKPEIRQRVKDYHDKMGLADLLKNYP